MRGFRAIVINSTWRAAPWADVLYAADLRWWKENARQLGFAGLCVCGTEEASAVDRRIRSVPIKWRDRGRRLPYMELSFDADGTIGHGGNSGFQAINLAAQFGAPRIALLGFDLRLGPRDAVHHHGAHRAPMRNPTQRLLGEWAHALNGQAAALEARGIEVLNASSSSVLTAFPKQSAQEIVELWCTRPSQVA